MKKIQLLGLLFTAAVTYAQSTSENYIYAKTFLSGDCIKKAETITYFDGLGRAKQLINVKATTTGKDLVTPITYDEFGRSTKDILPVPVNTLNAAIHTGIVNENTANSYYGSANAYSEKQIENSPLDRTLQQAQPGEAWKMSAGHTIKYKYEVNGTGEVKKFVTTTTTNGAGAGINTVSSISVATEGGGFYNAGILYKNTVTDEDGTPVIQFQNGLGQVLLIRRTDGTQNVDTYYVYNEYGQMAFVIPPKAVQQIEQNGNNITPFILESLCYQYRYDGQGREVEKRLPGRGDWESVVYDGADRAVLTQDANLKKNQQWMLTKYDPFGRVAYTGLIASGNSRAGMQNFVGNQIISETQTPLGFSKSGITIYYTNNFLSDFTTALMVNYYDSYPRDMKEAPPVKILDQFVVSPNRDANGGISTISLPTTAYLKNIENDSWTKTYFFYDTKGRKIGENSWNHLGGYTKGEFKLDFAGQPEESYTYHLRNQGNTEIKIKERFIYDGQNRLLKHYHQVDTQPEELLAENSYNDIGQLINKKTGNATGIPLQSIDYTYNIRGWLTKINDPANLNGKLFGYEVRYNNPLNTQVMGRYNGNITEIDWNNGSENLLKRYVYEYDKVNRLTKAFYKELSTGISGTFDEHLTYDLNGNIGTLKRWAIPVYGLTSTLVDDLTYQYVGNRLDKVIETALNDTGYEGGNNAIDYDLNGNMITMKDKGIHSIVYNYLNLPESYSITQNNPLGGSASFGLSYLYRADGVKLRKINTSGGGGKGQSKTNDITDYLDGFQYRFYEIVEPCPWCRTSVAFEQEAFKAENKDGLKPTEPIWRLDFVPTAEGFYSFEENRYIYQYKDHLGNARVNYAKNNAGALEITDANNYYPFGMNHIGGIKSQLGGYLNYKYNGKELQEMGMYDYGARFYMPDLGRWGVVDPLAEKFYSYSPYNYVMNDPIASYDPDGMDVKNDYKLLQNGQVRLIRETNDKSDTLYATDKNGKVDNSNSVTVAKAKASDSSIIGDLATGGIPDNSTRFNDVREKAYPLGINRARTTNASDVANVFLFAANN
ncbi:DUF6443 domain-containing protein [Chryseobacterium lactis]|nr:DUF6443 domain-containing protein [Chryseobacterium lactis]